jgi:aspartate carbamoyltransferase catalytic subunit
MDEDARQKAKKNIYRVPENVRDTNDRRMLIMHPMPRTDELPPTLDHHPDSIYYIQADLGTNVRMALTDLTLRPFVDPNTSSR